MSIRIEELLGEEAQTLLGHKCQTVPKELLNLPGPDFVERVLIPTDRPIGVLKNLQWLFNNGRLSRTGFLSILPVDQGIEHSAGASFAPNPIYFDPENIVKLAIEGGCNAVASTLGVLGSVARRYAHNPLHRQAQPQRALTTQEVRSGLLCLRRPGLRRAPPPWERPSTSDPTKRPANSGGQ